ncbi:MAG: HNH endonuclease signature motif containing protein [Bacteroidales bacterium]|jgi:5-methylcytosine-specific restriction endonuclease McrA
MSICPKCNSTRLITNTTNEFYDIHECPDCGNWSYKLLDYCCRSPSFSVVDYQYENGSKVLYKQCWHCGYAERNKPLNSWKFDDELRGEFNQVAYERRKELKDFERNSLYQRKTAIDYRNSRYYKYQEYLLSPEWKDKRTLVLQRDNNICQSCKEQPAEQVHHLTYDNLFNEPLEDLQALCCKCHDKIHSLDFYRALESALNNIGNDKRLNK